MLASDRSATPFGGLVDGYSRGIEWSDGDRALLGAEVRIRAPRSQRSMGSWWPMGPDAWVEFQALLISASCTTDAPAVQWLCPFAVLDGLGIVTPFNQARPDLIIEERAIALTDQYSDNVPYCSIVGTVVLVMPAGCPISIGELPTSVCTLNAAADSVVYNRQERQVRAKKCEGVPGTLSPRMQRAGTVAAEDNRRAPGS